MDNMKGLVPSGDVFYGDQEMEVEPLDVEEAPGGEALYELIQEGDVHTVEGCSWSQWTTFEDEEEQEPTVPPSIDASNFNLNTGIVGLSGITGPSQIRSAPHHVPSHTVVPANSTHCVEPTSHGHYRMSEKSSTCNATSDDLASMIVYATGYSDTGSATNQTQDVNVPSGYPHLNFDVDVAMLHGNQSWPGSTNSTSPLLYPTKLEEFEHVPPAPRRSFKGPWSVVGIPERITQAYQNANDLPRNIDLADSYSGPTYKPSYSSTVYGQTMVSTTSSSQPPYRTIDGSYPSQLNPGQADNVEIPNEPQARPRLSSYPVAAGPYTDFNWCQPQLGTEFGYDSLEKSSSDRQPAPTDLEQRNLAPVANASSPSPSTISATPSSIVDPLPCPFDGCNALFTGKYGRGNLRRHVRNVHGGRVCICGIHGCAKTFHRTDARPKHQRNKHNVK